jgi:cytochrome c oxidase subunit IV
LLHILSLIALTLGIAGVSTSSNSDNYHSSGLVKAAIIIFLVVFAGLVVCIAYMTIRWSQLSTRDQRKAVIALWISVPFLLVRLLYSTIADLSNDTTMFSEIDGNSTVYLCMSVLEEIIVAAVHVGFGLTYQKGGFGDPPNTDAGMDQGAELEGNSSKGSR